MRVERFYHSAPSAAESIVDSAQTNFSSGAAVALLERAFPQGLEASAYALRKRFVCPRWWLAGVMGQWLSRDSEQLVAMLSLNVGDWLLSGPVLNPKTFPLVASLWTEILSQITRPDFSGGTVELQLARIVRGTAQEICDQREFLTSYLSSALRIHAVRTSNSRGGQKRLKNPNSSSLSLTLDSVGLIQIVENVVLRDSPVESLVVTFAKDPKRLFSLEVSELIPTALRSELKTDREPAFETYSTTLVSLQPDILQAMSRASSPKKLCSYLALELQKCSALVGNERRELEDVWRGRALGFKELPQLHKEQLSRARSLYDHGILSWENEAPKLRVRTLAQSSTVNAGSGIVHCWRLSQHALDAVQFEHALSAHFRSEESHGPVTIASSVQQPELLSSSSSSDTVKIGLNAKSEQVSSRAIRSANSPLIQAGAHKRVFPVAEQKPVAADKYIDVVERPAPSASKIEKKTSDVWTDDEFFMCVAEFYESLTPMQQQAFERERKRMTAEQFRRYVTPALKRMKFRDA
ncbi:hypothetical protein EBU99_01700 [bacterium]|nr:hypothetical protein [bacterium]